MAGRTLSPRERRILASLEDELRQDRGLDRALSSMAWPGPTWWNHLLEQCGRIGLDWMVLLVACGLALGTVALEVRTALAVACTAGYWVLVAALQAARVTGRRRSEPPPCR